MLKGAMQGAIAFTLTIAVAYPLAREMSNRGAVEHELVSALDERDAIELRNWAGTTQSFVTMLRQRCAHAYGTGAPPCERYRSLPD
jgi:hypothetical protein